MDKEKVRLIITDPVGVADFLGQNKCYMKDSHVEFNIDTAVDLVKRKLAEPLDFSISICLISNDYKVFNYGQR